MGQHLRNAPATKRPLVAGFRHQVEQFPDPGQFILLSQDRSQYLVIVFPDSPYIAMAVGTSPFPDRHGGGSGYVNPSQILMQLYRFCQHIPCPRLIPILHCLIISYPLRHLHAYRGTVAFRILNTSKTTVRSSTQVFPPCAWFRVARPCRDWLGVCLSGRCPPLRP